MGDAAGAEDVEVGGLQEFLVADFDGVAPAGGELAKEVVEVGGEGFDGVVVAFGEGAELEDHDGDLGAVEFEGLKEERGEEVGVEVGVVVAAGAGAVAGVFGPFADGDLFGDFEGEGEGWGGGGEEALPVGGRGELVKGEIAADDGESLGIFAEAFGVEFLLGEAAAGFVALGGVDLAEPAFVFPAAGAEVNAFRGEGAEASGELGAEGGRGGGIVEEGEVAA